jgi:hypothetical protein
MFKKQKNLFLKEIQQLKILHSDSKSYLPSTVNICLITDNIKMHVYNILVKYLRHTDKKSVSVKLHIT